MNTRSPHRLGELAQFFLKLGIVGFGGPAVHIAIMDEEVVKKRQWLTREHFLDLLGATNLIPGPNSTEMAIHVGYTYGGWPGLIVAGVCFILPAVIVTALLGWVYVRFGTLPAVAPLLFGIKPAVLAIILAALWRLGKKAIKNRQLLIIALGVVPLLLLGFNEVLSLLLGGILGAIYLRLATDRKDPPPGAEMFVAGLNATALGQKAAIAAATTAKVVPPLWQLGLFFLKVGSVLFGSGYVLIAFLQGEVVDKYGWMTQQELLDAIAIGQFTPGPILSTSTFIGYVIAGIPGATIATIAIFLPSFFFVAAVNPLIPKLRRSAWASAFLDAVNVSAVALMAVVTLKLARTTLLEPLEPIAIAIAGLSAIAVLRFRIGAPWLVLSGAILGVIANFAS